MGFNPFKGITRALGVPDKLVRQYNIVGSSATRGVIKGLVSGVSKQLHPPAVQQAPSFRASYGPQPLIERQPAYGQTSYPQYYGGYGGGGGLAPTIDFPPAQPQQPFYGGSPWDFSTTSAPYSQAPSPVYSAPRDRTWEDLTSVALPVLASFL